MQVLFLALRWLNGVCLPFLFLPLAHFDSSSFSGAENI